MRLEQGQLGLSPTDLNNYLACSHRTALDRDPRLRHDQAITVFARAGAVTLRGTVESINQRHAAVEDARAVTGVEAVFDELDLRPFPHDPRDDEIRGAALQSLIRDTRVPEAGINVDVADSWLTLKGEVRHQDESDAAFEDVAKLEGVGGITNAIKVVTGPPYGMRGRYAATRRCARCATPRPALGPL